MDKPSQSLCQLTFENNQEMSPTNWRKEAKDIVDEIGIVQLMRYLNGIPSLNGYDLISAALMCNLLEVGLDYACRQLNNDQLVNYITGMNNLLQILVHYDSVNIHSSLSAYNPHTTNTVHLEQIHAELCPRIIKNPEIRSIMMYALSVVQIGKVVINRMHIGDMDIFDKILKTFSKDNKKESVAKSTPSSNVQEVAPSSNVQVVAPSSNVQAVAPRSASYTYHELITFMEQIASGRIPEERLNEIRRIFGKGILQKK